MRSVYIFVAVLLSACGGGEHTSETCTVVHAAYVGEDVALTSMHQVGTDKQLLTIGQANAALLGIDPSLVVVGPFAFCK